jgi:hypothetical protein
MICYIFIDIVIRVIFVLYQFYDFMILWSRLWMGENHKIENCEYNINTINTQNGNGCTKKIRHINGG